MKKQIKTYKTFDYYINKLIGIIAILALIFFTAVMFEVRFAVRLFSNLMPTFEMNGLYIIIPFGVAAYCRREASKDKENWKKKSK